MKKLRELYARFKMWRKMRGMSELGREVFESFQVDHWEWDRYTIDCKQSGIKIWYGDHWEFFRFYELPHSDMDRTALEKTVFFNEKDKKFLNAWVLDAKKRTEVSPAQMAITIIRASRYKDD
jgi:hypothetical protein